MPINKILIIILSILIILVLILLILFNRHYNGIQIKGMIYPLLIVVFGLIVYIFYKKISKNKMLQTTITPSSNPRIVQARLVLTENQEILIKEYEKVFGREDFLGVVFKEDLVYVGKKHFKISRHDDGFYIEDLDTKNGTFLNGESIVHKGKIKLKNEDRILVARTLELRYLEK